MLACEAPRTRSEPAWGMARVQGALKRRTGTCVQSFGTEESALFVRHEQVAFRRAARDWGAVRSSCDTRSGGAQKTGGPGLLLPHMVQVLGW